MRLTGLVAVAGLATALSILLVVDGMRQPQPRLEQTIRRLHRDPQPLTVGGPSLTQRVGNSVINSPLGARVATWRQALRLVGTDPATHVGFLVLASVAGFLIPALVLTLLQLTGVVSLGLYVPMGLSLAGAVVAPVALHADVMSRSEERRIDLRYQLSAYLDMVTMLLAGNTGHEGALDQAARAGDGALFVELRRRMREVAATGNSLVGALTLVGDDFGVVELVQVASAAQLSANEGAPVARTLAAKCSTLRGTLAAEQEAASRVRNDKVTPPLVGMAVLFMAVIIYPALNL